MRSIQGKAKYLMEEKSNELNSFPQCNITAGT